ncbi:uncharacterized protein DUF4387 [Advenella incenata]|uniref:Uncharacterized protein DUF4387 n=1 Tax=Advenella incenata TaxID=267800 RepID=A0A4Q7VF85_9BURK|nr:DUF4387 domain-containing protein [Advenella incenata]RZT94493.1 uncharacterized protein DUF4387 [Advenella incenata]
MTKIRELASICKSKNAGPFDLTIDVMFDSEEMFDRVERTGVLNAALFAKLYQVPEQDVLFTPYRAARAFKATFPRLIPAGAFGDSDVYGAQQHGPLLEVDIPV